MTLNTTSLVQYLLLLLKIITISGYSLGQWVFNALMTYSIANGVYIFFFFIEIGKIQMIKIDSEKIMFSINQISTCFNYNLIYIDNDLFTYYSKTKYY